MFLRNAGTYVSRQQGEIAVFKISQPTYAVCSLAQSVSQSLNIKNGNIIKASKIPVQYKAPVYGTLRTWVTPRYDKRSIISRLNNETVSNKTMKRCQIKLPHICNRHQVTQYSVCCMLHTSLARAFGIARLLPTKMNLNKTVTYYNHLMNTDVCWPLFRWRRRPI